MIEVTGNDLVIIASDPSELAEAQQATIGKMIDKEKAAGIELRQAQVTLESARNHKLDARIAERLVKKAEQRLMFVVKIREALEAGYVIVPNFPGDTIAIRVKRSGARAPASTSTFGPASAERSIANERCEVLPSGEGRYVGPRSMIEVTQSDRPKAGRPGEIEKVYRAEATSLVEGVALPAEFVRPTVMERTGKCMARRVFDEIAVAGNWMSTGRGPGTAKGDPMVLGRIFDRSSTRRMVTFLVAWFVDTSAI